MGYNARWRGRRDCTATAHQARTLLSAARDRAAVSTVLRFAIVLGQRHSIQLAWAICLPAAVKR